jgi:hypothetical protein
MPKRVLVLSQKNLELFCDIAPPVLANGIEPAVKLVIERLVVVAWPVIVVEARDATPPDCESVPTTCSVDDGWVVPIPMRKFALSQKSDEVAESVEDADVVHVGM